MTAKQLAPVGGQRESATETFPLLTISELESEPRIPFLIENVVPEGLTVVYAAPGTLKTYLALDWTLSIAAGVPWLGHATSPARVVYVAAEGRRGLGARIQAWRTAHSDARPEQNFRVLPEAVNLLDGRVVARMARTLERHPPVVFVLDTLARSMVGGDENSARDVGQLLAVVDELRGDGSAILLHHEQRKGAAERGSGALRAGADLMARLERSGATVTLKCEKPKDFAGFSDIALLPRDVEGALVLGRALSVPKPSVGDQALELLARATEPFSANAIASKIHRRRQDVQKALRELEDAGRVRATDDGYVAVPCDPGNGGNHPAAPTGPVVPTDPSHVVGVLGTSARPDGSKERSA